MKNPRWITAKDLYNYTKCLHRVYLDSNGSPAEKGEVSRFAQLLWELGLQTEQEYLQSLKEGPVTDLSSYGPDLAWEKTLEAMKNGVPKSSPIRRPSIDFLMPIRILKKGTTGFRCTIMEAMRDYPRVMTDQEG